MTKEGYLKFPGKLLREHYNSAEEEFDIPAYKRKGIKLKF